MEVSKNIDFRLYSRNALEISCKEFSEFCIFKEKKINDQNIILKIRTINKNEDKNIILEFLNYFLELTCQKKLKIR